MMNSQEPETHPRGDSDDEIAELRFQALLTKRENEAEISQAHEPCPFPENVTHTSINQPLSNFRGQPQYNYRGRGRGPYYKPYLQTFSQQIASQSVNSSNIVVLTSSDADESKQATYPQEWQLGGRAAWEQKGYIGQGGRWPGGGGQRMPIPSNGHIGIQQPAPRLILPQDKYAPQSQMVKDPVDQNKAKLSARMRRLQGSDSDSEDSESDSSDDSSSSDSSSDSNSSSSDTSSSDSDSDSDTNQTLVASKKGEKPQKKDKVTKPKENQSKHPSQTSSTKLESSQESNSHTFSGSPSKPRSPTKSMSTTELPLSLPDPKKVPHSPVLKKRSSRSPSTTEKRSSHHYSRSPSIKAKRSSRSPLNSYSQRLRSKSPHCRKSRSFSPRRYSRSPRRSRTPLRRYASRSPYSRKATSPLRGTRSSYGRYSKSPVPKKFSKSPVGRYRSRSPYLTKRFRSRSPYSRKSRSPLPPRKGSRSPLPLRRLSRSPLPPRLRSKSPYTTRRYTSRSPRPIKRYSSKSPPPASKGYRPKSRSPYGGKRYGTPSPRLYSRRSSSFSPKRHRIGSPRPSRPLYRSKSPRPLSPRSPQRRRSSFSPVKKFKSRSPIGRPCISPRDKQSPHRLSHSPGAFTSPQKIKRIGSISPKPFSAPEDRFSHVREKSPFTNYAPHPPIPPKRYEPPRKPASPPPRYMIEGGAEPQFERRPMTTPIFTGQPSSRGHNYGNRPPSPYFRERPLSEEGLQPLDRGPPRPYGMRLDRPEPFIGRGNRGGHFELNLPPGPKRYPNPPDPQHPPWHPHRAEPGPLAKPPPGPHMSHYPPKFAPMEPNYVNRPPFPQPPLLHPPLPDKGWPPNVPSRPFEDNFGPPHPQDRNHHRADRFQECGPPEHPRGRGRGFRGQRGTFRGVHARLGGRNSWGPPSLLGGAPGAHEPPPFGEPYIRERQERRAGPPIAMEQDVAFMDRRPPPFEPPPPLHPPSLNQKGSPGHLRIPRGPKTPPYSPKREPSPLEWQKRGQMNLKDRTPSLSPSPSRRYPNEPYLSRQVNQSNKQPRERDPGRMMESYDAPNQRRGRYGLHKFIHDSNRADQRMENREYEERRKPQMDKSREAEERRKPLMDNNREAEERRKLLMDNKKDLEERRKPLMDNKKDLEERRKPLRGDELRSRDNDVRKTHSSERGKPPPLEQRASNQEKDREVDNRRRSPHQEKSKSSSGDVRLQLDVKDDLHHRNKRERDTEQDPRNRREREREKESEEHRNKGERQTDRGEQNRQRELDKDQNRQRESDKDQNRQRELDKDQNRQRELDKDQNRQRESDKDQSRQRESDKDQNRQREKSDQRERSDQSDQKKRRENESKQKREREPDPDGKDKKEVKPKIDNYEVEEGKVKKPTESEKELDRGNPGGVGEVSRESVKHPSERRPSKERKPSKEVETTQTMKEADSKKLKDDAASDDADKKKKRKKKHREDEKSSKSSKKKKKEKKKKKDSKKKSKKGTKESDTDDSSPKKKKKSSYTLSGGPRDSDLRQMLTKKDESPREGALKRRKDIEDKLLDRKKRREDSREPDRDWKMASRARDRVDDRGRKDERTHYRDDRRAPERRDRSDDTNRGNKGLVVTLGSGANRHVMSSGNPSSDKGTKRDSGGPRIPVHMRLGPGSGPESASDEAKKLRRPLDTRRKPGVGAGRPRHQGMKGASKGSNR